MHLALVFCLSQRVSTMSPHKWSIFSGFYFYFVGVCGYYIHVSVNEFGFWSRYVITLVLVSSFCGCTLNKVQQKVSLCKKKACILKSNYFYRQQRKNILDYLHAGTHWLAFIPFLCTKPVKSLRKTIFSVLVYFQRLYNGHFLLLIGPTSSSSCEFIFLPVLWLGLVF